MTFRVNRELLYCIMCILYGKLGNKVEFVNYLDCLISR